jgi:hypothetical protein
MKKLFLTAWLLGIIIPDVVFSSLSFQNTPLKEVIQEIQNTTPYFFLYRESQIAGIRITLESTQDKIIQDLQVALAGFNIELGVDRDRFQVILTRKQPQQLERRFIKISGQVVDAESGERLPYASIMWIMNEHVKGATTNASGYFAFQETTTRERLLLSVFYIGYKTRDIEIELSRKSTIEDLTIRLQAETLSLSEIIVTEYSGSHPSDTLMTGLIDASRFSPLGESNSIRALQAHPSVSNGTALNNGLNVRGSNPDGFLVLLDGMTIFNQSHLFGLLDSFNDDVIQSAGYYFNIPPANIDAPTGGTLNLITRAGSRNHFRQQVGISNTSINGTLEGPLGNFGSWILSARGSYMDLASWFNNSELIKWGLDVNRPRRVVADQPDFTDLVLQPGSSGAQFIDLHGKFYIETGQSGIFSVSGYYGGDRTYHNARRRMRMTGSDGQFTFEDVKSANLWGNALLSLRFDKQVLAGLFSSTSAGISAYETDFEKDDFVYSRVNSQEEEKRVTVFTYPFRNRSTLNEWKLNQDVEYKSRYFSAIIGGTWKYYTGAYSESSFDHSGYFSRTKAHLIYTYVQTQWNPLPALEFHLGGRINYYSLAKQIKLDPTVRIEATPLPSLSLTAGYSTNQQFLHRVAIANATTADVWILSISEQPAALSTQFSAGIQYTPHPSIILQVNGYLKDYKKLRMHELNTQSLANTFSATPWFYQNSGHARGAEIVIRNRWRRHLLTQSYTLSRMTFQNPFLLEGNAFFADWDRTHSYNAVWETRFTNNFRLYLSWIMMSGAPNALSTFGVDSLSRLDSYYRFDLGLTYLKKFSASSQVEVSLSIFNLLNRDNVWYRSYSFNYDETRSIPRLTPVPVDVLDLGIHPSFKIQYAF